MDTRNTDLLKEKGSGTGGSEGARRATGEPPAPATVVPDPEVAAVAKRRQFSPAYKRRVVRAADACKAPGEAGALLRREGLYSSHLSHWRREFEALENGALSAKRRGPKPDVDKAHARRVEGLERDVARLVCPAWAWTSNLRGGCRK
jgi:transposase